MTTPVNVLSLELMYKGCLVRAAVAAYGHTRDRKCSLVVLFIYTSTYFFDYKTRDQHVCVFKQP
jgi:hypothetical protein